MDTRRAFVGWGLGALAATVARPAGGQQQGQAGEGGLRDRGAPTGRTGAATRGADGGAVLDLVAPLRGIGLTSTDQPELCYLLSGRAGPVRLAISTPGQARPLAALELPRTQPSGLGIVRLRDHGVRLAPDLLCIWSVTVAADPRAPSQDLVGTALIQYRPGGPAFQAAAREASLDRRLDALVRAGYWYDAVALAVRNRDGDGGAALARLLRQAELRVAAGAGGAP